MLNKTLSEIIEAVKDGNKPEYDELFFALLALSYLHGFDKRDILNIYDKSEDDKPFGVKWIVDENWKRTRRIMNVSPKEYIGDNWHPDNPEYQKQRAIAKKLAQKIMRRGLND